MLSIKKVNDKTMNLDVQGEGCWSDCYIGAYWEMRVDSKTKGCKKVKAHYNAAKSLIF